MVLQLLRHWVPSFVLYVYRPRARRPPQMNIQENPAHGNSESQKTLFLVTPAPCTSVLGPWKYVHVGDPDDIELWLHDTAPV